MNKLNLLLLTLTLAKNYAGNDNSIQNFHLYHPDFKATNNTIPTKLYKKYKTLLEDLQKDMHTNLATFLTEKDKQTIEQRSPEIHQLLIENKFTAAFTELYKKNDITLEKLNREHKKIVTLIHENSTIQLQLYKTWIWTPRETSDNEQRPQFYFLEITLTKTIPAFESIEDTLIQACNNYPNTANNKLGVTSKQDLMFEMHRYYLYEQNNIILGQKHLKPNNPTINFADRCQRLSTPSVMVDSFDHQPRTQYYPSTEIALQDQINAHLFNLLTPNDRIRIQSFRSENETSLTHIINAEIFTPLQDCPYLHEGLQQLLQQNCIELDMLRRKIIKLIITDFESIEIQQKYMLLPKTLNIKTLQHAIQTLYDSYSKQHNALCQLKIKLTHQRQQQIDPKSQTSQDTRLEITDQLDSQFKPIFLKLIQHILDQQTKLIIGEITEDQITFYKIALNDNE